MHVEKRDAAPLVGAVIRYEVQGRRTERGTGGGVVRDHVRLASTESRDAAFKIATTMAAEEFKAWVFRTERISGRTSYVLLGVVPEQGG